ncbi:MAG: hypothetical protein PHY47_18555 [Lachnospiraceae bacterium]|nr:hypothetical protein [Lachnospiraceae bacterium]
MVDMDDIGNMYGNILKMGLKWVRHKNCKYDIYFMGLDYGL